MTVEHDTDKTTKKDENDQTRDRSVKNFVFQTFVILTFLKGWFVYLGVIFSTSNDEMFKYETDTM